jgi:transcriptional regulator with XRE-family HTH domain
MIDYSFGNWIKRRRKALDLSQQDLAERVGCSVSAIFKIESDERRPSRQIAELLAEQLQIPRATSTVCQSGGGKNGRKPGATACSAGAALTARDQAT